ncbi:MAG: hypothetical protein QOG60_483, partial [Frankiaceae bacterium]|nr:hypothetical protein [Frankiaceae bacterium]
MLTGSVKWVIRHGSFRLLRR